jgi:hypothetical protein
MERLTAEDVQARARQRATMFSEYFDTETGKEVLKELRSEFCDMFLTDGVQGHDNIVIQAAQRDVIHWIEEIIQRGRKL